MKRQLSIVAAAAIAAGSYAFLATGLYAQDEKTTTGQQVERAAERTGAAAGQAVDRAADAVGTADVKTEGATAAATLPPGIQKATSDDSEDIRDTLGDVVENALKKDGFEDLVGNFVDADRNRLGSFAEQKDKLTTLNGRIAQIQKDFKAKYNKDFEVDHQLAFGAEAANFRILQGEIVNPQLLTNWPVKATPGSSAAGALSTKDIAVDQKDDDKIDTPRIGELGKPSNEPGDRNLEKGRNVAIVHLPASHGMQPLAVSMIHELPDTWKIDVPDNVDGQRLHDQLLNHLTILGEHKDMWPADVNEFYRLAAHHVLAAVYDVNAPKQGASGAGATSGTGATGGTSGTSSGAAGSSSTPK